MAFEILKQRKRGFICVNSHPEGCRLNVERQIESVRQPGKAVPERLRNVLVVGSSTGYGLASRIVAAWAFRARTVGVFLERAPREGMTATAGFYNSAAFHRFAERDGLPAFSVNADAFSNETKKRVADLVRKEAGPLDLVVYSLAAPRRVDPETGQIHNSAIKPVGQPFTSKTIDLKSEKVVQTTLAPATETEIADTVAVMGGDDWSRWIEMLLQEGLLAPGFRTLAYSYIGPEVTWPIYKSGTIGRAKQHLEVTGRRLDSTVGSRLDGRAWVSVNPAVPTQASVAIPVVPLYLSVLSNALRQKGLKQTAIGQIHQLFLDLLTAENTCLLDDEGRIRMDQIELRPDVQECVMGIWARVTTENLLALTDFSSFRQDFNNLFGFDVQGVDYSKPVDPNATDYLVPGE